MAGTFALMALVMIFNHNHRLNVMYYEMVHNCEADGNMWIPTLGSNGLCITRGAIVNE
jgi:hypothetical protein